MAGESFTIETKLKIAGIEAVGKLNAGTLVFDVDASSLQKLVRDAGKTAEQVKAKFDNIKLNKLKIEINQNSLRQIESQIRNAVQNAVGKAKITIDTSIGGGTKADPFRAQRDAAGRSAEALKTLQGATKDVSQGMRSLVSTLSKLEGVRAGTPAGGAATAAELPLPTSARMINTADLTKEIAQIQQVGVFNQQVTDQQIQNAQRVSAAQAKADDERHARLEKLKNDLDLLFQKEQKLTSQLGGGGRGVGGGGGGGGIPPGGFGATPPGGNFDKSRGSVEQLQRAMADLNVESEKGKRNFDDLNQLAFEVGRKAAAFRGVAIAINTVVNASKAAASFLITFNDSLRELNKILKTSDNGLQIIGNELFELSANTGVAVDQTISIAQEFARAGLDGRGYGSVVDLTNQALKGLQGTTLDAGQSTQFLIQIIQQAESGARGLNKEIITSGRLFDILGRAEDITASTAQDVAEALKRSAASIFATGSSIEEVTALISVLQERTQRGGDVIGTALKTIASRVGSASSEASQALKSIGVSTVDTEGKLRNIFDILRDTAGAFRNLSEVEQAEIAVKAAGLRQVEIFRAALQDFNRLQDVETELSNASGDAARKQAIEQEKLANTIQRIQIALQALVKTASEGILGQAFGAAIKFSEKLLESIASVDKVLGGTLSTFAGFLTVFGAAKALIPLISGIGKAFSYFLGLQKESEGRMVAVDTAAKSVAVTVSSQVNTSLQATATIMQRLNVEMLEFQKRTELSAIQSEKLAKAQALAKEQLAGGALAHAVGVNPTQIGPRAQQLINEQQQPTLTAREAAQRALIAQGGAKELVKAGKESPGSFTGKELERIARLEKSLEDQSSKLGNALNRAGSVLQAITKSTLLWGVGLSAAAGLLGEASRKARDAGDDFLAAGASVLSTATEFGAFGALFGPFGVAIAGAGGALIGLIKELNRGQDTIEDLGRKYVKLGLIQAENGQITSEASKELEKAFKNIQAFKNFRLKLQETESKDLQDPNRVSNRQKKLADITDSLASGFDRAATAEERRNRILETATKIAQETTGTGIDLTSKSLTQIDDKALRAVTQEAFDKIVESFAAAAQSPEAAEGIRNRGAELLATSTPERFGSGRQNMVSEAGVALARALNEFPDLVEKSIIEAQDKSDQAQRQGIIDAQHEAFQDLRTQLAIPLSQAGKLLGTPVNKLQIQFRSFIDDFGREVSKLREATIQATTPQKELADRLAEFAQKQLTSAQREQGVGATDIINEFRKAIQKIPGGDRPIGRQGGQLLPGFDEQNADKTVGQVKAELVNALLGSIDEINQKGIIDIDAQRKILEEQLQSLPSLSVITEEDRKTIVDQALETGKKIVALETETNQARINLNKALVTQLQNTLSEQQKELAVNKQRREVLALNAQAALEELTGIRELVAQRKLEAELTQQSVGDAKKRVNTLDSLIAKEKAVLAVDASNVAAQDKLKILTEERTQASIELETELAKARIDGIKNTLAVAREAIEKGKQEADFQKNIISSRAEIIDLLSAGEKEITKFNNKLATNTALFRTSQAELAGEAATVNATISDQAEKQARLADIEKRATEAALEHAKAEAEVIAERREAIKQVAQELLSNEQAQIEAQKAIIEATQGVAAAFQSYLQAVDGAILATTQYNINLRLVEVQNNRLLGGFAGLKEQISAVQDVFRDAENASRAMGASEKTLTQIRRDSINQQLQLFTQLLQEQSSLARNFFQSSAQEQANLFLGIREAQNVAQSLGGSFENFKKLGENAINELGAQILSLPQETRQRIIQSLESLKTVGGNVGGFTPDQLLNAIETASLGVSKEGLDVDPLFEVQQRIANLTEEQARLANEQLISTNEQVKDTKRALEEAQAQKDLAKIQLDRVVEEGDKLRGKLTDLQGNLQTTLLQQDQTARTGFSAVTSAVAKATAAITSVLPDALSVKIAQAFREVLSAGNISVPGLTAPQQAIAPSTTVQSRGTELSQSFRQQGSNQALQQQLANQSGSALNVVSEAVSTRAQQSTSNLPDQGNLDETNRRLDEVVSQLETLNATSTTSSETLATISEGGGTTTGVAAATTAIPDINVNIQGTQTITVTGFEAGVARIAATLAETFGGFVTEQEARNIANEVIASIRLQLERLGILARNQL